MRVAISGDHRSGKDYLGSLLSKTFTVPTFAFADEVKIDASLIFPDKKSDIYQEGKTLETRELLCNVSMRRRSKYPNFYTNLVFNQITGAAIITDLRYSGELQRCQDEGFIIVFLGSPTSDYDLPLVYSESDIRLPLRPDINVFHLGCLLKDLSEIKSNEWLK